MKYLLLLLLSFNIFADHFIVKIKPNNPKHGELSIDAESQEDAKQKLVKWVERQKVYKSEWGSFQPNGIKKDILDDDGNTVKTVYLKPLDYSFEIEDHTQEENEKKAKENKRKDLKDKLKEKDLNLKEVNELLRMM